MEWRHQIQGSLAAFNMMVKIFCNWSFYHQLVNWNSVSLSTHSQNLQGISVFKEEEKKKKVIYVFSTLKNCTDDIYFKHHIIFPLAEKPVIITAESNNSQTRKHFQIKTLWWS